MIAKEIYDLLTAGGLSRAGALGMLGNMMAESSLKPNIAQRGMTKLSDEQYTAAADNGLIDFANDGVGYGLYQLTYHKRKRNYLDFAKSKGTSVGDLETQIEFCLHELKTEYAALYKYLCESTNIDSCSDKICSEFERPAVNNFLVRRNFAHEFEKEIPVTAKPYTPKPPVQAAFPIDATVLALQLWMQYNGYDVEANGYKSKAFFATLREFVDDMESC